jgi:hypothetical protein
MAAELATLDGSEPAAEDRLESAIPHALILAASIWCAVDDSLDRVTEVRQFGSVVEVRRFRPS